MKIGKSIIEKLERLLDMALVVAARDVEEEERSSNAEALRAQDRKLIEERGKLLDELAKAPMPVAPVRSLMDDQEAYKAACAAWEGARAKRAAVQQRLTEIREALPYYSA